MRQKNDIKFNSICLTICNLPDHLSKIFPWNVVYPKIKYNLIISYRQYQGWSPRGHILKSLWLWPWPRSLKSLALASKPSVLENCLVLGSRTALFFEPLKFCWKTPETLRKICKYLFRFPQLEHRLSQAGLPCNWNFTNDKNVTKKPIVSSVSVSFQHFSLTPIANNNIEDQGPRDPLKSIFTNQFKRKPRKNG